MQQPMQQRSAPESLAHDKHTLLDGQQGSPGSPSARGEPDVNDAERTAYCASGNVPNISTLSVEDKSSVNLLGSPSDKTQLASSPVPNVYVRKYGRTPAAAGSLPVGPSFKIAKGPDANSKGFRVARAGYVPGPEPVPEPVPDPDMTPLPPIQLPPMQPLSGFNTVPQQQGQGQQHGQASLPPQQMMSHKQQKKQLKQAQHKQQQQQLHNQHQSQQQHMYTQQQMQVAGPSAHPQHQQGASTAEGASRSGHLNNSGGRGGGSGRGKATAPSAAEKTHSLHDMFASPLNGNSAQVQLSSAVSVGATPQAQQAPAATRAPCQPHTFNPTAATFTPGLPAAKITPSLSVHSGYPASDGAGYVYALDNAASTAISASWDVMTVLRAGSGPMQAATSPSLQMPYTSLHHPSALVAAHCGPAQQHPGVQLYNGGSFYDPSLAAQHGRASAGQQNFQLPDQPDAGSSHSPQHLYRQQQQQQQQQQQNSAMGGQYSEQGAGRAGGRGGRSGRGSARNLNVSHIGDSISSGSAGGVPPAPDSMLNPASSSSVAADAGGNGIQAVNKLAGKVATNWRRPKELPAATANGSAVAVVATS